MRVDCTDGAVGSVDRTAPPMLSGVSCGFSVERVSGIEPALSADPKIGQLLGARQFPAERSGAGWGWCGGSGGAFEDDCVAECFELADVVAAAAVGVGAAGVEVWAEVGVAGVGVG
jgi:hypothetical protein